MTADDSKGTSSFKTEVAAKGRFSSMPVLPSFSMTSSVILYVNKNSSHFLAYNKNRKMIYLHTFKFQNDVKSDSNLHKRCPSRKEILSSLAHARRTGISLSHERPWVMSLS